MKKALFYIFILCSGLAEGASIQQERLTEYLTSLVAMQTVTEDQEENLKALQWVEEQLSPLGLYIKRHTFNGYHTLVITTKETQSPDLFLVAHIDVVPAPEEKFHPYFEGRKMYGRGAYDMKMAIACYILLFQELKGLLPAMNIGIMLTSDEEIGGMNGVKPLLESGYSSKLALLPDGGFDWNFEEAAKGVLHVKVSASGKSAHSSRPWEGENAIDKLTGALSDIHNYFAEEKRLFGDYFPTVNVGIIQGGKATNQVPDFAEAKIDIRYPPAMKGKDIYTSLEQLLRKDASLSLEVIAEGSAHRVDLTKNPFHQFRKIANEKFGIEVGKTQSFGSSDARFFGERNIPVLVIAPKGGDLHGDGEWVDMEDLERFYQVLKEWVLELSKSGI